MSGSSGTYNHQKFAPVNEQRPLRASNRLFRTLFDFAFLVSLLVAVTMIAIALPKANVGQRVSTPSGTSAADVVIVKQNGYYPEEVTHTY